MKHYTQQVRTDDKGRIITPDQATMVRNITTCLRSAKSAEYQHGLQWYLDAHTWASGIAEQYGTTTANVAQITSLLSPQIDWSTNMKNVGLILEHGETVKIFASAKQKARCMQVLDGTFSIPESAQKTFAFADCIARPRTSQHVVIDRHAIKIALGVLGKTPLPMTSARFRKAAQAYVAVADEFGIMPHQVQAITWVTYKRVVNR